MELSVNRSVRHWWVFLIRGILFITVGIYMICSPASSFAALGFFFGLVILLAGIAELLRVTSSRNAANRGWHLMLGLVDLLLGIVLMGHIAASEVILRMIVGIWFLFGGISLISFSRTIGWAWLLMPGGIITAIFGLLIIFNTAFGSVTIIVFTAIAFIITGIFNAWLGYIMKPGLSR
ncbi:MAG: protein of unknown function rane [Mucilaginibacter sp.]|nr:protein of unknown function rane [Mucilaginibacter sp.]